MSEISDLAALDWRTQELPDGFVPVDAIVLVKGYYLTDDADMTRLVWAHMWTRALAGSPSERVGQLEIAKELCVREAMADYRMEDGDE